jgi:hypothetical protein
VLISRHNALELAVEDGRSVARRYVVYACVMKGSQVASAEVANEPAEVLGLPLTRESEQPKAPFVSEIVFEIDEA